MGRKTYSVGIYARLSVEGGGRKNESIETQIEIAKEYMLRQSDMILYDCYSDLGRTGTNFDREGFERLMMDVRLCRVDCVIVKDFSRFGRNYIETGNYIQKVFPFLGVRFISVTDGFDSLYADHDDMGMNLKNLANEMYARDIAVKVKSSKRTRWERGSYTGGVPPYGYRTEWICRRRSLLVDSGAAGVVKEVFGLYDQGRSLGEIAECLYGRKIHRPAEYRRYRHLYWQEGEELRQWCRSSLRAMLTNPVYLGCLVRETSCGEEYKLRKREGIEQKGWSVKEKTHEAIISEEQFLRVAKKHEKRQIDCTGQREDSQGCPRGKDVFDGILFCGCCGKKLGRRGAVGKSGTEKKGCCCYFCRDSARIDELRCRNSSISRDDLAELVRMALKREFLLNGTDSQGLIQENRKCAERGRAEIKKECAAIQKKLKAAERAGSEGYRKYREGALEKKVFQDWRLESERKTGELKDSLIGAERRIREADAAAARQELFLKGLLGKGEAVGEGEGMEKGEDVELGDGLELESKLMSFLIERINIYPDRRVEIVWKFQAFAPGCGRAEGKGGNGQEA